MQNAERILLKAETLANELNSKVDIIEERVKQTVNESLRARLVQEIDEIAKSVLKKTSEKKRELKLFPTHYYGNEVWIQAIVFKTGEEPRFHFDAVEIKNADKFAKEMEKKGDVRYTLVEEFEARIETLKSSIIDGKLDKVLRMKAGEVVWEITGYGGKLLTSIR